MDYLTWAKTAFSEDKYATELTGIDILEVDKHYAKCKLDIKRCHQNVTGMVMGGAIFTLADFTFAIASNAGNDKTVTASAQINYLAPADQKELIAEAICVKDGKSICYYEVTVKDENQKLVSKVSLNGFKIV